MGTILQDLLAIGRAALVSVAARTVVLEGRRVPAIVNEAVNDDSRRGTPDLNTRNESVIEINALDYQLTPKVGQYVTDDANRNHRIKFVKRVENLWRLTCEPTA